MLIETENVVGSVLCKYFTCTGHYDYWFQHFCILLLLEAENMMRWQILIWREFVIY